MFNKISSFNIRSEKTDHWNDVFIAQPDALKENLAGKVFLLAEFFAKKNQGERIFNFIVDSIEETYYNDEKLLLKEKIEGLKTENIFEAALAKTNQDLALWLEKEKISLNLSNCNLTLGVVFENHIHFSNFGRNKALLLYPQKDKYEVINVETNAFEKEDLSKKNKSKISTNKVFSSVVSGDVPKNSYFIFSSESLPEYISEKELSLIISKLPPLTAAYQIKNLLEKINLRVPFFGAIIKSASETDINYYQEEALTPLSANNSISSLKNIEKKTEDLLTSSNIINLSKVTNKIKSIFKSKKPKSSKESKVVSHLNYGKDILNKEGPEITISSDLEKKIETQETEQAKEKLDTKKRLNQDFGIIRTLGAVKKDSNIKDEKFSFKKSQYSFFSKIKIKNFFSNIFSLFKGFKNSSGLNKKLIIIVPLLLIILTASIIKTRNDKEINDLNIKLEETSSEIKSKESLIESKLLYNDRASAFALLEEIKQTISNLTLNKHSQSEIELLQKKAREIEDKVNLITRLSEPELVQDFSEIGVNNLITVDDKLYLFSNDSVFKLTDNNSTDKIEINENINSYSPVAYDKKIYLFNNKNLISINTANDSISKKAVSAYEEESGITSFSMYSEDRLYLLRPSLNKIDSLASPYSNKSDWLKEDTDLKNVSDLYIDGDIYFLENNGDVFKYRLGKKQEYSSAKISSDNAYEHNFKKISAYGNKLYLFNSQAKKIVVLNKADGLLLSQYLFEDLTDPRDFAVDQENSIIYLIDQDQVLKYKI